MPDAQPRRHYVATSANDNLGDNGGSTDILHSVGGNKTR